MCGWGSGREGRGEPLARMVGNDGTPLAWDHGEQVLVSAGQTSYFGQRESYHKEAHTLFFSRRNIIWVYRNGRLYLRSTLQNGPIWVEGKSESPRHARRAWGGGGCV